MGVFDCSTEMSSVKEDMILIAIVFNEQADALLIISLCHIIYVPLQLFHWLDILSEILVIYFAA